MNTNMYEHIHVRVQYCLLFKGGLELLEFEKSPEDRELARGETVHHEECKAKVVDGDAHIEYIW